MPPTYPVDITGEDTMMIRKLLGLLGLLLLCLPMSASSQVTNSALPTFEVLMNERRTGGEERSQTRECTGIPELPFPNIEMSKPSSLPPLGLRETRVDTEILLNEKKTHVTLVIWQKSGSSLSNISASKVQLWIDKQQKNPLFLVSMRGSAALPILPGCVKFELWPEQGEKYPRVSGMYIGETTFQTKTRTFHAYKYKYRIEDRPGAFDSEIIVSDEMPGTYCAMKGTGVAGSYEVKILDCRDSILSEDLHHFTEHRFALAIPDGWKIGKTKDQKELVRLIPEQAGNQQPIRITIETRPAEGLTMESWASRFFDKHESEFGLSFDLQMHMGGEQTFTSYRWSGTDRLDRGALYGCKHGTDIYLVIVWVSKLQKRDYAEYDFVKHMIGTWRWLPQSSPTKPSTATE
ncbi:MAG: hypothetical protein ACMUIL_10475 [bacterium]